MPKNYISNGDFSADSFDISPWSCLGGTGVTCGVATELSGGNNNAPNGLPNSGYIHGQSRMGQETKSKAGETYNLTYYAYAYDEVLPDRLVGWTVQVGSGRVNDNQTTVFSSTPPDTWPFYSHAFQGHGNDVIGFETQNNTSFQIDDVRLTCTSCSSPSNAGAIAGGVVGGVVVIALLGFGFIWFRRRKRIKKRISGDMGGSDDGRAIRLSGIWNWKGGRGDKGFVETPSDLITSVRSPFSQPATSSSGSPPPISPRAHNYVPGQGFSSFGISEGEAVGDMTRPDVYPVFQPGTAGHSVQKETVTRGIGSDGSVSEWGGSNGTHNGGRRKGSIASTKSGQVKRVPVPLA